MSEITTFIQSVEQFIVEHGWSATRFGKEMANDPRFVFQIRDGREPRSAVRDRVLQRMLTVREQSTQNLRSDTPREVAS